MEERELNRMDGVDEAQCLGAHELCFHGAGISIAKG